MAASEVPPIPTAQAPVGRQRGADLEIPPHEETRAAWMPQARLNHPGRAYAWQGPG